MCLFFKRGDMLFFLFFKMVYIDICIKIVNIIKYICRYCDDLLL